MIARGKGKIPLLYYHKDFMVSPVADLDLVEGRGLPGGLGGDLQPKESAGDTPRKMFNKVLKRQVYTISFSILQRHNVKTILTLHP